MELFALLIKFNLNVALLRLPERRIQLVMASTFIEIPLEVGRGGVR